MKYAMIKKVVVVSMLSVVGVFSVGNGVNAAQRNSSASVTVHGGRWNPFKHDTVSCYLNHCKTHPGKYNYTKATVYYEVKSSAKNSKHISKTYDCTAYGATHGAPAYTEPNNASDCKYNIETKESDKYTAYGRYKTGDCYYFSCQLEDLARGSDSYESNSNKGWSGWVSE